MTKAICKNPAGDIFPSLIVSLIVITLIPQLVSAKESNNNIFCRRLSDATENAVAKITDKERETAEGNIKKLGDEWKRQDDKTSALRAKQDIFRKEEYEKIKKRAQKEEEIRAVEIFSENAERLFVTRRKATDDAVNKYREEVIRIEESREALLKKILGNLKTNTLEVFERAVAVCKTKGNDKTRLELQKGLREARGALQKDRQELTAWKNKLETARKTREGSLKQTALTFRTSLDSAVGELKKAF